MHARSPKTCSMKVSHNIFHPTGQIFVLYIANYNGNSPWYCDAYILLTKKTEIYLICQQFSNIFKIADTLVRYVNYCSKFVKSNRGTGG